MQEEWLVEMEWQNFKTFKTDLIHILRLVGTMMPWAA